MGIGDMGGSHARPSQSAERRGACSIRLAIRSRRLPDMPRHIEPNSDGKQSPVHALWKCQGTASKTAIALGAGVSLSQKVGPFANPRTHAGAKLDLYHPTAIVRPLARAFRRWRRCHCQGWWRRRRFARWRKVRPAQIPVRFDEPDCRRELRQVHRQAIADAMYKAGRC
jgi:hypothetical protein